jgi:putative exosortase-associated protein (TIGR04073 family)
MKKIPIFFIIFAILAGLTAPARCDGPVEKLSRGLANTITFPCEIPYQISQTNSQNGLTAALSYGVLNGIFMTGVRAIVGIYEIVTFPIPAPGDFGPILTNPEFFFNAS